MMRAVTLDSHSEEDIAVVMMNRAKSGQSLKVITCQITQACTVKSRKSELNGGLKCYMVWELSLELDNCQSSNSLMRVIIIFRWLNHLSAYRI